MWLPTVMTSLSNDRCKMNIHKGYVKPTTIYQRRTRSKNID